MEIPWQQELVFAISWRLPQTEVRRSKTVRLAIAGEIVDQYEVSNVEEQQVVELRIQSALKGMLRDFDPTRDVVVLEQNEIVRWQLSLSDMEAAS